MHVWGSCMHAPRQHGRRPNAEMVWQGNCLISLVIHGKQALHWRPMFLKLREVLKTARMAVLGNQRWVCCCRRRLCRVRGGEATQSLTRETICQVGEWQLVCQLRCAPCAACACASC